MKSGFTAGSRFGFKGAEDLGNGYQVGFVLEQGFDIDSGEAAAEGLAFNREANLWMSGPFGRINVGRLGTLDFAQTGSIRQSTPFGVTWGAAAWGTAGNLHFSRVDNAVSYSSPSFGGFSLSAMYSNGRDTDDSSAKWSKNDHYYGLGGLFKGEAVRASIILEAVDNKDAASDALRKAQYHLTLGGQWKLGAITPMGVYQYQWGKNYWTQHAFQVGATTSVLGGTARFGFKFITRKVDGEGKLINKEKKANLWNLGLGYEYKLSKRTKVYGYTGYTDGGKGWATGSQRTNVNYNGYQVACGMVHDF